MRTQWRFWLVVFTLTAAKLWLDSGLRIRADTAQLFDDAHYIRLAHWIAEGKWLGDFDQRTLSKSVFYPLWLAFNYRIGAPLLLAQAAASALVGLLLLRQLLAIGVRRPAGFALYTLLLFNPFVEVRVLREGIYPALVVLVFACIAGMYRAGRAATRAP